MPNGRRSCGSGFAGWPGLVAMLFRFRRHEFVSLGIEHVIAKPENHSSPWLGPSARFLRKRKAHLKGK
jgi:hypothetical protein